MRILCLLANFEIMNPVLVFSGSNISSVYSAYLFSEGWWYQFYRKVSRGAWRILKNSLWSEMFYFQLLFSAKFLSFFFFFALDICTKKGLRKINIQLELFQVPNHCCMTEKYFIVITCKPFLWGGQTLFYKIIKVVEMILSMT